MKVVAMSAANIKPVINPSPLQQNEKNAPETITVSLAPRLAAFPMIFSQVFTMKHKKYTLLYRVRTNVKYAATVISMEISLIGFNR